MKLESRRSSKRRRPSSSPVTPSEPSYQVQEILASRTSNGKEEFHVKWKGFGMNDCTWEPEENIEPHELVVKFRQRESKRRRRVGSPKKAVAKAASPLTVSETIAIEESSPESAVSVSISASQESSTSSGSASAVNSGISAVGETATSSPADVPSTEASSSTWVDAVPPPESKPTSLVSQPQSEFDPSQWTVQHLGPPPYKGVPGHWALVIHTDGLQEYVPIQTVRDLFPNQLFDYLLPRIRFGGKVE